MLLFILGLTYTIRWGSVFWNDILFKREKAYVVHYKDAILRQIFLPTSLCLIPSSWK